MERTLSPLPDGATTLACCTHFSVVTLSVDAPNRVVLHDAATRIPEAKRPAKKLCEPLLPLALQHPDLCALFIRLGVERAKQRTKEPGRYVFGWIRLGNGEHRAPCILPRERLEFADLMNPVEFDCSHELMAIYADTREGEGSLRVLLGKAFVLGWQFISPGEPIL